MNRVWPSAGARATVSAARAPAAPTPILYDELQPERFAQALSGDPRNDVGIPARSIRNDNVDRLLRPTL